LAKSTIDFLREQRDGITTQIEGTREDRQMLGDQRAAVLKTLIAQRSTLDEQIAEAEAVAEAERRAAAGKDQAERSEALAAATRLPNAGDSERRTATRVEVRHNEPLPKGATFADLTDTPADFREFGNAMRALAYGDPRELRAAEGTDSAGGFLVAPKYAAGVLDLARAATQVANAGATVVPLDSNDVTLAKVTGDPTPAWRTESSVISSSDIEFGAVHFDAKALAVVVKASWELIEDAENFGQVLAQSLASAFAVTLDHAALYGSGTDPEPLGLKGQATSTGTYPAAGIGSYDPLINAVASVRTANYAPTATILGEGMLADLALLKDGNNNYMAPPAYLANVPNLATTAIDTEGTGEIFTGAWANLMLGIRTAFEVKVLNERFADTGEVGFVGWLRADVQVARSDAFAIWTPAAD
jgi:HK97 family phage major capsid protein